MRYILKKSIIFNLIYMFFDLVFINRRMFKYLHINRWEIMFKQSWI